MQFTQITSTRGDGNMDFRFGPIDEVADNRQTFLKKNNLSVDHCVMMRSLHKDIIEMIDEKQLRKFAGIKNSIPADTLFTQMSDVPLVLETADCLPVVFFDEPTHTLALSHISRHTLVLGLVEKTLQKFNELGGTLSALTVSIGPHIHKKSYSFNLPLAEESKKLAPHIEKRDGRAYIDLSAAVLNTLVQSGVSQTNISISPTDTYSNADYFSHVESVSKKIPEGRLITAVCVV